MSILQLNPYLLFKGTAAQAIALYERALGAQLEHVSHWSAAPGMELEPQDRERVMHASLQIGGNRLMLADVPGAQPVAAESNVQVVLEFDEVCDLEKRFDALAAGGKVELPPQDMFWGARFGMLTDAYGIRWMLTCELPRR